MTPYSFIYRAFGAVALCTFLAVSAFAQIESIPGAGFKQWNNPATWVGNMLPSATDNVIITSGSLVFISSGVAAVAADVTIESNGRLDVAGGTVIPFPQQPGMLSAANLAIEADAEFNFSAGSSFEFSGTSVTIDAAASIQELPNISIPYSTFRFLPTFNGVFSAGNRHFTRVEINAGARVVVDYLTSIDDVILEGTVSVPRDLTGLSGPVEFGATGVSMNLATVPARPVKGTAVTFTVDRVAGDPTGVVNAAFDQGEHFVLSTSATTYNFDLTLPHGLSASDTNAFVTRVVDVDLFDAARDSSTSSTVTRNGITSISGSGDTYAVTNGFVVPVELGAFSLE